MIKTMNYRYWQIPLVLIFIAIYSLLFYTVLTKERILDFTSFYTALLTLINNENPYRVLFTTFFPVAQKVSANLNPPIVLWLAKPLSYFSYQTALTLWTFLSLLLGLIAAGLSFHHAFSTQFLKKNRLYLYLFYLSLFSTMMNISIVQLGSVLFFFIMVGYHFYLKKHNYLAGIFWGLIIAMKLFPALLFFYVLKQRRFKVLIVMLVTFLLASLLPLVIDGPAIYSNYYSMMSRVLWYGDSWNASIYGYLFRLFIDNRNTSQSLIPIQTLYLILFFISLIWYLKKLGPCEKDSINHQPFCLTLTMMLFMSPFGWLYYFPMLTLPLLLSWIMASEDKRTPLKSMLLWILCLFLINFPLGYVRTRDMPNFAIRISFSSCYFYGLFLLTYLLTLKEKISGYREIHLSEIEHHFIPVTLIILAFGLIATTLRFSLHLY